MNWHELAKGKKIMFDYKKFLQADEQTQRLMIAEVIGMKPAVHINNGYNYCKTCGIDLLSFKLQPCRYSDEFYKDFRILAFELRDKVDRTAYKMAVRDLGQLKENRTPWDFYTFLHFITSVEMIAASLMAWPEKKGIKQ